MGGGGGLSRWLAAEYTNGLCTNGSLLGEGIVCARGSVLEGGPSGPHYFFRPFFLGRGV